MSWLGSKLGSNLLCHSSLFGSIWFHVHWGSHSNPCRTARDRFGRSLEIGMQYDLCRKIRCVLISCSPACLQLWAQVDYTCNGLVVNILTRNRHQLKGNVPALWEAPSGLILQLSWLVLTPISYSFVGSLKKIDLPYWVASLFSVGCTPKFGEWKDTAVHCTDPRPNVYISTQTISYGVHSNPSYFSSLKTSILLDSESHGVVVSNLKPLAESCILGALRKSKCDSLHDGLVKDTSIYFPYTSMRGSMHLASLLKLEWCTWKRLGLSHCSSNMPCSS